MEFTSSLFIFICLPLVLTVYYLVPRRRRTARNAVLLLFSFIFYAFANPAGLLILLVSIASGHFFAVAIERVRTAGKQKAAKAILHLAVGIQLMLFAIFYYLPVLLRHFGVLKEGTALDFSISFPIGIAFYSVQIISILSEVCAGRVHMEEKKLNFALAVSFFPKVARGPILSYRSFQRQIEDRKESMELFGEGAARFMVGLAKKLLLADTSGQVWSQVAARDIASLSAVGAWIGFFALAFELYFDLSGYCDMAIGLGQMFGFTLPENVFYPYQAENLQDFRDRWNMTVTARFAKLSSKAVGGDKDSDTVKTLGFLLFGIIYGVWHGATAGYLVFGAYFGAALVLDQIFLSGIFGRAPASLKRLLTFLTAGIGWIFLMIGTPSKAVSYLAAMVGAENGFSDAFGIYCLRRSFVLLVVMAFAATPFGRNLKTRILDGSGRAGRVLLLVVYAVLFAVSIAWLITAAEHPFILFGN